MQLSYIFSNIYSRAWISVDWNRNKWENEKGKKRWNRRVEGGISAWQYKYEWKEKEQNGVYRREVRQKKRRSEKRESCGDKEEEEESVR